jgi:hypothetical protein
MTHTGDVAFLIALTVLTLTGVALASATHTGDPKVRAPAATATAMKPL